MPLSPIEDLHIPTWTCSASLNVKYTSLHKDGCSYRILGNRTWVGMDTIPKFLQGVPCFHQLSYSLPLPWHWACPDRDASSAGTQKEKTGGTETANLQPACNLKAKCTFVVVSLWDLRVARQKAKLTLTAYYTQINEVNARSLGGTQSHAKTMPGVTCGPSGL